MRLKTFLLFIICGICSCSNNDVDDVIANQSQLEKPSTEIFVQGQKLESGNAQSEVTRFAQSRVNVASGVTYSWPYINTAEGWETARFSIRADGTLPGYIDQSSALYYGRPAGKQGKNRGRIASIYPYGHYNDRDYDYYKKGQKTGNNIGLFRYVYDPDGMKTQLSILEQPSVIDILGDEKADLEAAIAKGQNITKNQKALDDVNSLIEKGEEYLNSHILWYTVKEVGGKNLWHVNGIIVDYIVPDARADGFANIPDNVEVDIHQQIHKDWNEIKTSIHIRTDCESVKINIPLEYEDIIEQDDFNIRVFGFYYKEYTINHTITHDSKGITIEINNIPGSLIKELKDNYGDGLTVEIHSYCTKEDIWEQLSKSCVEKTGKPCTVNGQITTAFDENKKVGITVMNPGK